MCGVVAILLVKSAVFVLLTSFKGLIVLAAVASLYLFLRGPRDPSR